MRFGVRRIWRVFATTIVVSAMLVVSSQRPAVACTCFGGLLETAEIIGPPDLVFSGAAIDSGPSNVTAEWSDPPEPGLAMLFSVDAVWLGEVGATVVVHTPAGGAGSGTCAIDVPSGTRVLALERNGDGDLIGGLCSVHEFDAALTEVGLTDAFGPPRGPDDSIAPDELTGGEPRPPDPEDLAGQAVFDDLGGELPVFDGSASDEVAVFDDRPDANSGLTVSPFVLVGSLLLVVGPPVVVLSRRHTR